MRKNIVFLFAKNFNSRPSARGDPEGRACCRCTTNFNSRPSARGDAPASAPASAPDISIHAPPRGATDRPCRLAHALLFQFTPLREGRLHCVSPFLTQPAYFNSRPSARGDAFSPPDFDPLIDFNSRPSARGDPIPYRLQYSALVFQFTPLREGRLLAREIICAEDISIHAPPRGATRRGEALGARRCISIHAPPRGATAPPSAWA